MPKDWATWRMVTRSDLEGKPLNDGFTRLCLNNPGYRLWKKSQIARTLARGKFDGVDIAEPHWPEYPGIKSPAYACFCSHCLDDFRKMFPEETDLPDIIDLHSPRSPGRNPDLWRKWLAFREASVTDYLNDLVNGRGGIRQRAPRAKVATWTLALAEKNGLRRVLVDSGENAGKIVEVVKPDLHCLQTHWPDWIRADLSPAYVEAYRPFIQQIRDIDPIVPLMIQADTGSRKQNRRAWDWIEESERHSALLGACSTTFYAYDLGKYIYADPPRITEVRRRGQQVELLFAKRLDPASAGRVSSYHLMPGRILKIRVDGSLVLLDVSDIAEGGVCALTVKGISDDAERRLFKDLPAAVLEEQTVRFRY
jgi:hypothetical protein